MENPVLTDLYDLCRGDVYELHRQLQNWGLVPKDGEYKCKRCGSDLQLSPHATSVEQLQWVCHRKVSVRKQKATRCNVMLTYRLGTFFAQSHLSLYQILGFVHLWVLNTSLNVISLQLKISEKSAVDWTSFCREVVYEAMYARTKKLGGPGVVVEIDESKFGCRKYHGGHKVEGQWVFGGYERCTGREFMVPVEKKGADTLLPIVQEWILPGTTIISDCWKVYDCLQFQGYAHLTVNHSITFKDPETGVYTNNIEAFWRAAKSVCGGAGRKKAHIHGNLAKYMFYKRCNLLQLNRAIEFYRLVGELYNPVKNVERQKVEAKDSSAGCEGESTEESEEENLFLGV